MHHSNSETRSKSSPPSKDGIPQLEDGFTQIPNEMLNHLALIYLRPDDWRVLMFIIRKTLGFHKKVDYIANFQIVEGVNLHKTTVSHSLRKLHSRNLIVRRGKLVGLQPDCEQWIQLKRSPTTRKLEECPTALQEHPIKVEGPRDTQKKKETYQKKGGEMFMSFTALKGKLNEITNKKGKIGFLGDVFKALHPHAPPEDLQSSASRIAGILKTMNNDYGYLLKLIWDSSSANIAGSHLNYIHGTLRKIHRDIATEYADSGHYKPLGNKRE